MEELREVLGQLYEQFGHTEVTVALSQYLDKLVIVKQKEKLEELKRGGDYENKGRNDKVI